MFSGDTVESVVRLLTADNAGRNNMLCVCGERSCDAAETNFNHTSGYDVVAKTEILMSQH